MWYRYQCDHLAVAGDGGGLAAVPQSVVRFLFYHRDTWWRHHMETFSALLVLCEGNPPVTGGFPSQRPVMRSFDVFFDLRQNKRLRKYSRRRWFEMPSLSLWRHSNDMEGDLEQRTILCNKTWYFDPVQMAKLYHRSVTRILRPLTHIPRCCFTGPVLGQSYDSKAAI